MHRGSGNPKYIKENIDRLTKGDLSNSFDSYGSNNLKISKKGSDIKEKLGLVIATKTQMLQDMTSQLIIFQQQVGFTPDQPFRSEQDCPFNRYDYCFTYVRKTEDADGKPICTEDQSKLCNAYNDMLYAYCDTKNEVNTATFLQRNFEDNKSYDLTMSQAKSLGF